LPGLKRPAGRLESQLWKLVRSEEPDGVGVVAGAKLTAGRPGGKNQDDVGAGRMLSPREDVEDPRRLDLQAGLLERLALRRPSRVFVGVDETGRQRPAALLRFDRPAYQQDLPILDDEDSGGDLRIFEVNPAAARTGRTGSAEGDTLLYGMAAFGAEADGPIGHPHASTSVIAFGSDLRSAPASAQCEKAEDDRDQAQEPLGSRERRDRVRLPAGLAGDFIGRHSHLSLGRLE